MAHQQTVVMNGRPKRQTRGGFVPKGTRGVYDPDPAVRRRTALAMVSSRRRYIAECQAPGCVDPKTGRPRTFYTRVVHGEQERRACSAYHRLLIWRKSMEAQGYKLVTVDGVVGWRTPDGEFVPNPNRRRSDEEQIVLPPRRRKPRPRGGGGDAGK